MQQYILIGLIIIFAVGFIVSLCTHKVEAIVNFVLRALIGTLGIYCLNLLLAGRGIAAAVGINETTVLTVGLLGLPGFVLLYAISIIFVK